jgi:membrane protein DedA with SNARE-associated domain
MPWGTFTACALAGAAVWTALFMGAGAVFHRQILVTLDAVGHFGTAMLVLLTAILGLRWGRRLRGRLKRA